MYLIYISNAMQFSLRHVVLMNNYHQGVSKTFHFVNYLMIVVL